MEFEHDLGQEVEDVITGYVGYVVTRMDHITGCATYIVQRRHKKGEKIEDSMHFDENRLRSTGKKAKLKIPKEEGKPPGAIGLPKGMRMK